MSQTFSPNAVAPQPMKGDIAFGPTFMTLQCQIYGSSASTFYPGQAVKIYNQTSNSIIVEASADTDAIFGTVLYNVRKNAAVAYDMVTIALPGSIVWMETAAAVTAGGLVEIVNVGLLVQNSSGTKTIIGMALVKATAANQLIPVLIGYTVPTISTFTMTGGTIDASVIGGGTPAAAHVTTLSATGAVTLTGAVAFSNVVNGNGGGFVTYNLRTRVTRAQLNAGLTLLAAATGLKYRLISYKAIAYGGNLAATANATGIAISGTQTTGVALATIVLAGLTRSTVNTPTSSNNTVLADGASFIACDATTAITVAAVAGTDLITATGVDIELTYAVEA